MAFLVFSVSNLTLTLFASIITAFIAPAAAGSGIPEVKAYLNGVDAPGIFSLRTLIVKVGFGMFFFFFSFFFDCFEQLGFYNLH
jgi:H+/Cl- antiporter ClcA